MRPEEPAVNRDHKEWDEFIEKIPVPGSRSKAQCHACRKVYSSSHATFVKEHKR